MFIINPQGWLIGYPRDSVIKLQYAVNCISHTTCTQFSVYDCIYSAVSFNAVNYPPNPQNKYSIAKVWVSFMFCNNILCLCFAPVSGVYVKKISYCSEQSHNGTRLYLYIHTHTHIYIYIYIYIHSPSAWYLFIIRCHGPLNYFFMEDSGVTILHNQMSWLLITWWPITSGISPCIQLMCVN